MAAIELLIQLAQRTTDERSSDLGTIGRACAEADAALAAHEHGMAAEGSIADGDLEALAAFGQWAVHAARNGARLQDRRAELGRTEATAREALREAFAQTKRLELAREAELADAQRSWLRAADTQAAEQERTRTAAGLP
jgi:hypothetical protein